MVKVTMAYIQKRSKNAPKNIADQKEHAKKLTHLYLNDQYIDSIGDISNCKNLKVLFLQNNNLEKVENLHFASGLTHLYLQRNKISKIEGFEGFISLQKLYLGHNSISVVEGLEKLGCLIELHIENQKLCAGEELIFDPRTIAALGHTLQTLNIQGNNLTSLEDLVGLDAIEKLFVACNNLSDVTKIQAFLSAVPSISELDMRSNPVVQNYKNCNSILASAHHLRVFNGKQISSQTLDFMKRFEKHQQNTVACQSQQASSDLINSIAELAYDLPEALAKDITSTILKDAGLSESKIRGPREDLGPPLELIFCGASDGSYSNFPPFKSSTCLKFDGHTIPKPFHRQIILGAQSKHGNQSSVKVKAQQVPSVHVKRNIPEAVKSGIRAQNVSDTLSGVDCGIMISGKKGTQHEIHEENAKEEK